MDRGCVSCLHFPAFSQKEPALRARFHLKRKSTDPTEASDYRKRSRGRATILGGHGDLACSDTGALGPGLAFRGAVLTCTRVCGGTRVPPPFLELLPHVTSLARSHAHSLAPCVGAGDRGTGGGGARSRCPRMQGQGQDGQAEPRCGAHRRVSVWACLLFAVHPHLPRAETGEEPSSCPRHGTTCLPGTSGPGRGEGAAWPPGRPPRGRP